MNQFIQRIANYVANEIVIKGLANSKNFQRFAVRTDAQWQKMKDSSSEAMNSQLDELHKAASQRDYTSSPGGSNTKLEKGGSTGPPTPPGGFFSAMKKEILKDLGIRK